MPHETFYGLIMALMHHLTGGVSWYVAREICLHAVQLFATSGKHLTRGV